MTIRQLSVFVENRSGGLADITEILAEANIDIRALSIADTVDYGILRLIVDNPTRAAQALSENDFIVNVTEVIACPIDDTPGGLARILRILTAGGVNLEYVYAFLSHRRDAAYVVLRVEDNDAASALLESNGINLAAPDEIYYI